MIWIQICYFPVKCSNYQLGRTESIPYPSCWRWATGQWVKVIEQLGYRIMFPFSCFLFDPMNTAFCSAQHQASTEGMEGALVAIRAFPDQWQIWGDTLRLSLIPSSPIFWFLHLLRSCLSVSNTATLVIFLGTESFALLHQYKNIFRHLSSEVNSMLWI